MKPVFTLEMDKAIAGVYLWETKAELNAAANKVLKQKKRVVGAYVAYRTKKGWKRELHYMKKYIGAGYVAHEIMHMAIHAYELTDGGELTAKNEEEFVLFIEEATRQFWDKFYASCLEEVNA